MTPVNQLALDVAMQKFITVRLAVGVRAPGIAQYHWAFNKIRAFEDRLPTTLDVLLPALMEGNLSRESRRSLVKCWRAFFRFVEEEYGLPSPIRRLPSLPGATPLPRVLTAREVTALVGSCRFQRNLLAILTLLDTGVRIGELHSMRKGDIDGTTLTVRGKTDTRVTIISPEIAAALEGIGDETHYWVGQRGPLTVSGLQQVVKRAFRAAGIAEGKNKNGPHTLRHTFATQYLRGGGGIFQLQKLMGHASLRSTMIYVHLAARDLDADHLIHSPARTLGLIDDLVRSEPLPEFYRPTKKAA